MSKKFDEEYLAALEDSTPDLWDRIESNIDENLVREVPKAKTKKKKYSNKITYIALPVAALALALVLIPMAMGRMGANNAVVNMVAYDMVEESMEEDYVEEASAGIMEEDVAEEATEEVVEMTNERVEDAPQEAAEEETSVVKTVEYFEGTFVALRYEADVLPDISVQELGYQYVYVVEVISTDYINLSVGEEITIYATEELPVDLSEIRLKVADALEGYLVVERLN